MTQKHLNIRAPSSLKFLAGILGANTLLAAFWIAVPQQALIQVVGLISSFVLLLVAARSIWEYKLNQYTPPAPKPGINEELQHLLVEQLQFVVLQVGPELNYQLETRPIPANLGHPRIWSKSDIGELLLALSHLSLKDVDALKFHLKHAFGMGAIQWQLTAMNLPRELEMKGGRAFLRISYVPVFENEMLQAVRVIVQDISEIKQREEQVSSQRKEMEKFFALLQVSDSLFELFMGETRRLFEDIRSDLKQLRTAKDGQARELATRLFRAVHTIKANARLFKLDSIQDVAHHVESYLDELRQGKIRFSPSTLSELGMRMQAISEEVYSYASLRKEILSTSDRNSGANLRYRVQWLRSLMSQFAGMINDPAFEREQLGLIQREFSRALSSFDRASLKEYLRGYQAMLDEMARELGKEVRFETAIEFHHFESIILTRVNDIILHCLRNAIDHGVESPDVREAHGKPRHGTIRLSSRERNGLVEITLHDDGCGIDVDKIRQKAVELGILTDQQARVMPDDEVVPLLFNVGVSTAATVTQISGRGLGMDVVRDSVHALKGQLKLAFEKGRSTTISFLLPSSSEDYLAPLAIHDIRDILTDAQESFGQASGHKIAVQAGKISQTTLFADSAVLKDVFVLALSELRERVGVGKPLSVTVEEHLGKRKIDSFVFYRIRMGDLTDSRAREEESRSFERATELVRKSGGSLYVKNRSSIEINLPSNMPVPFADYTFKVVIFSDRADVIEGHVQKFFAAVMGGWHVKVYRYSPGSNLPPELSGAPSLVLIDSHYLGAYVEVRTEKERSRDGIILFPEAELDIEGLNETGIHPENLLFAPPAFDEQHLHRCLVSIIFRRFLKEMAREKSEAQRVAS